MPKSKPTTKPKTPKSRHKPEATAPPTTPLAEQGHQPANPRGLPVVYDKLVVVERSTASPHGPLEPDEVKDMLGWEREPDYQQRMVKEKGGKPEHYLFGDEYHCYDTGLHAKDGKPAKVRCWNNAGNRPFDEKWCEELIHTILYGQWAGPLTVPGETVNGETMRVSRYGRVLSAQHQGTALVLADEYLELSRRKDNAVLDPKYPFWVGREHCVLETLIVYGLSEDERVLRTIDYVKPRSVADMLYTMELFRTNKPSERQEMTRMLAAAINTLWDRTAHKGYKTHPELVGFLERHRRLLDCVEHLFVEDSDRKQDSNRRISKLRLNTGVCSALCYLMGSGTQATLDYSDEYRNECPPNEKKLDWGYWNKAREFWARLAGDRAWMPVRESLTRLLDSAPDDPHNPGLGGRADEKIALLAKAWERWREWVGDEPPFRDDDLRKGGCLSLAYITTDSVGNRLPPNKVKLVETVDFRGIDCPKTLGSSAEPPMHDLPTEEQIYGRGGLADQAAGRASRQ